jgi:WD40-like Beta Propeller Repeat
MIRTWRTGVSAAALLALAAACSDTGDGPPTIVDPPLIDNPSLTMYGVYESTAQITCDVTMSTLAVQCGSPQLPFGSPNTVGGKGMRVRLVPSNVTYNAGTGAFAMDVKFTNLLVQQIGTSDGPTVTGLSPFFTTLPTRTGGTGSVSLTNPDGTATFTAANQRYFLYPEKVAMLASSANRNWQFNIASTTTTWRFRVYVSAETLPVIVFDKETGGNRDIYRVALDGSDLVRLTTNAAGDVDPVAAQGWVVWSAYRRFSADLYSMPLQGGGAENRISSTPSNHLYPAINPNATALLYTSDETGVSKIWSSIFTVGAGTINQNAARTLFSHTLGSVEASPNFLPGTSKLLVYVSTLGTSADIYTLALGGVQVPLITSPAADVEPVYNPAGTQIAFTSTRDGDVELYLYTVSGGLTTRITNRVGYDAQPTWLPDGRLVYISEVAGVRQLQWINPTTLVTGVVPVGAGVPRNPSVVPLY